MRWRHQPVSASHSPPQTRIFAQPFNDSYDFWFLIKKMSLHFSGEILVLTVAGLHCPFWGCRQSMCHDRLISRVDLKGVTPSKDLKFL